MSRVEALQALLGSVETGDDTGFRLANRSVFSTPCQCMELQMREENSRHAYKGSLDAAKALHDAVLPEWRVTHAFGLTETEVAKFNLTHNEKPATYTSGQSTNPARAWLIAILKALIEQEKT